MGQQPFPKGDKLKFIIQCTSKGFSDLEIQEALTTHGPDGKVKSGEYGAYNQVGIRTLLNIRQVYSVAEEIIRLNTRQELNPALIKAREGHINEIRKLIEHWRDSLRTPSIEEVYPGTLPLPQAFEDQPLFDSLNAHLLSPSLWQDYSKWARKENDYIVDCQNLAKDIRKHEANWKTIRRITDSFERPIFKHISEKAEGKQPKAYRFEKRTFYRDEQGKKIPDFETLQIDGHDVLDADDALACKEAYEKLSTRILRSQEVAVLIELFKDLRTYEPKIRKSLDRILLRRDYILHKCKLCPGEVTELD